MSQRDCILAGKPAEIENLNRMFHWTLPFKPQDSLLPDFSVAKDYFELAVLLFSSLEMVFTDKVTALADLEVPHDNNVLISLPMPHVQFASNPIPWHSLIRIEVPLGYDLVHGEWFCTDQSSGSNELTGPPCKSNLHAISISVIQQKLREVGQ